MSDIAATLKKELTEISEKASRVMRDYSTMTARCEAAEQANNELNSQLMKEAVRADKAEAKLAGAVEAWSKEVRRWEQIKARLKGNKS